MKLHLVSTTVDNKVIDLDLLFGDECCVTDSETLFAALLVKVANWVQYSGGQFSDIYCDTFDGDDETGFDLGVAVGSDFFERLREVALMAWYMKNEGKYVEEARVFAVIENQHIKYFDFESIQSEVEDDYHGEIEDEEDWARQYLEDTDQALPDGLESYFDYQQFGEDLIRDSFTKVEWCGQEFIYSC